MSSPDDQTRLADVLTSIRNLEARLSRLEARLDIAAEQETAGQAPQVTPDEREEALEIQIGQNWFAKAGIVGVALGIAFLLTFPYSEIPPALPSVAGYVLVGGLFVLSRLLSRNFDQISRYLLGGGMLLLFFTTLRLAHFTAEPVVADATVEFVLLAAVLVVNLFIALRRVSPYLTSMIILLGCVAALLHGHPYVVVLSLTILTGIIAHSFVRHGWTGVLVFGTAAVYTSHLLWSMNNPLRGNTPDFLAAPEPTITFVLVYLGILGFGAVRGLRAREENLGHATAAALNGGAALLLIVLLTVVGQRPHIAPWHLALSIVSLSLAVIFWTSFRSKYSTFLYAMLGYVAMSVAIADAFPMPDYFVWLCWESMLVLITAVWFRSRFIVVANFLVYLVMFAAYLVTAGTVSIVSISFGVVALLSARVLNWKKERLELRTEIMRNAYLGSALFVLPYALYHTVPPGFVSLSWLTVALCYYVLSRVLKNRKYRWMALLTTILTVFYVFLVDLVGVDPTFRIVSFLALGTALLATSMFYTRRKAGKTGNREERAETKDGAVP